MRGANASKSVGRRDRFGFSELEHIGYDQTRIGRLVAGTERRHSQKQKGTYKVRHGAAPVTSLKVRKSRLLRAACLLTNESEKEVSTFLYDPTK